MMEQVQNSLVFNYSEQEIRTLKNEKKMGYVFFIIILSFGALFSLIYITVSLEKNMNLLYLMIGVFIGLSFLVLYLMNRKINKDLLEQEKEIFVYPVQSKEFRPSYENHGLFSITSNPNGQSIKKLNVYYIVVNYVRYLVDIELLEKVEKGDEVELHFSKNSKILLQIVPKNS